MRRKPSLQLRVDGIHQGKPITSIELAPGLGGNAVAGHLGLNAVALDDQVVRGFLDQPGEAQAVATGAQAGGGTQQMEKRNERGLAGQPGTQPVAQSDPGGARQAVSQAYRLAGQGSGVALDKPGKAGRGGRQGAGGRRGVSQPGQREFQHVSVQRGAGLPGIILVVPH